MTTVVHSPDVLAGGRPAFTWADRISEAWQKSTTAIIETGRLLIQAKDGLERGQWLQMIQAELPFNQRTAQRLMAIAQHPVLSNTTHVSHLPSSWGTLYELTKLPESQFKAKLSDGTINPKMERRDVAALLPNARKTSPTPSSQLDRDSLGVLQRTWDGTPKEVQQQFVTANAAELREMLATTLEQAPALTPPDDYPDLPAFLERGNPACGLSKEMTEKDDGCLRS
jgi:hypothetical protein